MSEEKFLIPTEGLADFEFYDGDGPQSWLEQDGYYAAKVKKATMGWTKNKDKMMVKTTLQVLDPDAVPAFATLYTQTVVSGVDSQGKSLARGLGEIMGSMGRSLEEIRALSANGNIDGALVCDALTRDGGATVYIRVRSEEYQGKYRSVAEWTQKAKYDTEKAAGNHRRPRAVSGEQGVKASTQVTHAGAANGASVQEVANAI